MDLGTRSNYKRAYGTGLAECPAENITKVYDNRTRLLSHASDPDLTKFEVARAMDPYHPIAIVTETYGSRTHPDGGVT